MTSVTGSLKQIPLNNGYFRPIPSLIAQGAPGVSSFMYTLTSAGALTNYVPATAALNELLSTGGCLLKDMGAQYLSTNGSGNTVPRVLRRVQVVVPGLAATNGVGGPANGLDSDYNCAYIEMGFNNAMAPGPFVRTG